jgi:hypothetical protein
MAESILLNNYRMGRNGFDPPHLVSQDQVIEANNVDFYGAGLARRRGGAASVSLTGGTALNIVNRIHRYVPGSDETAAEMWLFTTKQSDGSPLVKRLAAGTTWADVTGGSLIHSSSQPEEVETTTLDGRLYIAARSATGSRLLVYDTTYTGGAQIRYVGFTAPSNPTVANQGSGTMSAVARYYRIRWVQKDGSTVIRRSEPSTGVTITPSGSGLSVRVTQPTPPGVGETHWEVEATAAQIVGGNTVALTTDPDGNYIGDFYLLSSVAVATTTYDDSTGHLIYDDGGFTLSADRGEYSTWPNVRYIISDGNRLIGAGSHISGEKTSRIYFSQVLGSSDQGDAERVPVNTVHENFMTLNEKDGGAITGLAKSINGSFYAFKRRQIWEMTPTGDDVTPYLPRLITAAFGSVSQASIVAGRDLYGNPAIYFWSEEGPCRLVIQGAGVTSVEYLGQDIYDLVSQVQYTLVAHSTPGNNQAYPFTIYYPAKHQVWFFFKYESGANAIRVKAVLDVMQAMKIAGEHVRGGWSVHTSYSTTQSANLSSDQICGVLFARTLGASMSMDLVPYVGYSGLLRCDTTDTTDNGDTFQAYIKSRPLDILPFGDNVGVGVCNLLADAQAATTIQLSLIRDYGLETRTSTVSIAAEASETKVNRKFESAEIAGAGTVQFQLGDASAVAIAPWKLHQLSLTIIPQEPR